jgi:hypothetical protein
MIVDEVDIQSFSVLEAKDNAPIRAHRDRPKFLKIALQRVQPEGRQIEISHALGCVEQSQDLAYFPDMLGIDAPWVVILEKLPEPFVPETPLHRFSTVG